MQTAYYVIAYSAVLKAVDEFMRMREIIRSVNVALKYFIALKYLIVVILVDVDLLAIRRRFPLIFAFYKLKFRSISTSVLFYPLRQD